MLLYLIQTRPPRRRFMKNKDKPSFNHRFIYFAQKSVSIFKEVKKWL